MDAHVLSDVHTDCNFQVIPDSDLAVTRFKMLYPALKSKPDYGRYLDDNKDPCHREPSCSSGKEDCMPNIQHDNDGDPVLDRHPNMQSSSLLPKIKRTCSFENYGSCITSKRTKLAMHSSNLVADHKEGSDKDAVTDSCDADSVTQRLHDCSSEIPCFSKQNVCCSERTVTENMSYQENDTDSRTCIHSLCQPSEHKTCSKDSCIQMLEDSPIEQIPSEEEKVWKSSEEQEIQPSMFFVNIKHHLATDLSDVGKQVWNGSLLLCDFIIHNCTDFVQKNVVELGAGVGLCSILTAMYAATVYCTDVGKEILDIAESNISASRTCPTLPLPVGTVHLRELDWFQGIKSSSTAPYGLTVEDVASILNCDILLAADVIYDFDITDAFFSTVQEIMSHPPNKVLYIALEKRLFFTVEDLDVTSPAYNYFRLHLEDLLEESCSDNSVRFEVEQLHPDFPQSFYYTRSKQMELWKITSSKGKCK